jgi:hypothetical protein
MASNLFGMWKSGGRQEPGEPVVQKKTVTFGGFAYRTKLGRLTGMKFTLRDKCAISMGLRTRASFGSSKPEELAMDGPKAE